MTVQDLITAEARRQGVDPRLALAVAQAESSFNPNARGSSGEVGLFQLMPGTAQGLQVNPHDVNQNVEGGVRYLRQLLTRYGGNEQRALMAYNGGPGHVDRGTVSSAAQRYAVNVLALVGRPLPASASRTAPAAPAPSGYSPSAPFPLPSLAFDASDDRTLLVVASVGTAALAWLLLG